MKKTLLAFGILVALVAPFFGDVQAFEDPCFSCQVSGLEGDCTAIAPGAGFGFKNCSIVEREMERTICRVGWIPPCITIEWTEYDCTTSNRCLLAPPS